MKIFNRRDKKDQRIHLRNQMNDPEKILWSKLKSRQIGESKFRRQHSIGPYIVDFFCPEEQLVIEVDGDSHYEEGAVEYDQLRDRFLEQQGLRVVRFTNVEVRSNLEGVILVIGELILNKQQ